MTRAGIHADGLLKNEEIYNIFDTEKFLNRPVLCAISNTSGLAGIAHWLNTYYKLKGDKQVQKTSELVAEIKKWVDEEYAVLPCLRMKRLWHVSIGSVWRRI